MKAWSTFHIWPSVVSSATSASVSRIFLLIMKPNILNDVIQIISIVSDKIALFRNIIHTFFGLINLTKIEGWNS